MKSYEEVKDLIKEKVTKKDLIWAAITGLAWFFPEYKPVILQIGSLLTGS
jgi:hypothetical protein